MPRKKKEPSSNFGRLDRPPHLRARVEQLLRQAIASGRFADGRLPTENELAKQLGVSRETVRLAAEVLQREGLLVKIRRKGTFLQSPSLPDQIAAPEGDCIGYLQAGYRAAKGNEEEGVSRLISSLMLQGAIEEAGRAGLRLVLQHATHTQVGKASEQLRQDRRLRGVIFAHYGEEKQLRRMSGLGLPVVLVDHDLNLPGIHSVRDDSFEGARQAVQYLASLGHRRIAFANWHHGDLNPWRLEGYRQGLRDADLPRKRAWELSAELTATGAGQAMEELLALTPRPTALYCFNNTLARLVIDRLSERAVNVPEEISVMGGGGEEVAGLTCHQADWHAIGSTAVKILLRALTAPADAPPEHLLSPHTLRPGHTTSSPSIPAS
jgi:LacI family transcriptional regulator